MIKKPNLVVTLQRITSYWALSHCIRLAFVMEIDA